MTKPRGKWLRGLLALLFLALLLPPFWFFYGQFRFYQLTFGPHQAEKLLAWAGLPDARIETIEYHGGGPELWMDGIEKFVARIHGEIFLETAKQPLTEGPDSAMGAPGLWYAADSPDPAVQSAIRTAKACAETNMFGTRPVDIETSDFNDYRYSFRNVDKHGNVTALVYGSGARGDRIVYLHCNF